MHTEAVVAGAGPAGLAAAARARHIEVVVLERMPRPGHPPHCTGITSPRTAEKLAATSLKTLEAEDILEAVYTRAVFLDHRLRHRCSLEAKPLAVKLHRPRLEEHLARLAQDEGHRILYRHRLLEAKPTPHGVELTVETPTGTHRMTAARLLAATGLQAHPPRGIPEPKRCLRLHGLEERIRLTRRIDEETFTTIHATSLAPNFFAWIAPAAGGREAVIGTAAPKARGLHQKLEALKQHLQHRGLLEPAATLHRRGGTILRGPPRNPYHTETILLAGDLQCATKPYTGGGLYTIAETAAETSHWLQTGDPTPLNRKWRQLKRELAIQHIAARIAAKTPSLTLTLLARACKKAARGQCTIDFDRHTTLLKCLLKPL